MPVIHLPLLKSCLKCEHFESVEDDEGRVANFCRLWREPIDDERVAAECPDYEPREEHHEQRP